MPCALVIALIAMADVPADAMTVHAVLTAERLEVGQAYPLSIKADFANGWTASGAGIPKPILQLDVPDCIELEGKVLTDDKELAKNEFLQAPFERMLEPGANAIRFTLKAEPSAGDHLGINVVAYATAPDGAAYFLRRRMKLAIEPGARAVAAEDSRSTWGEQPTLHVGDKAAPFAIKRADGSDLALADFLGKHHVIVTTYRAHW